MAIFSLRSTDFREASAAMRVSGGANSVILWRIKSRHEGQALPAAIFAAGRRVDQVAFSSAMRSRVRYDLPFMTTVFARWSSRSRMAEVMPASLLKIPDQYL